MKKKAVATILKGLMHRAGVGVHKALFRHMVKTGLILCAVEPSEDGHATQIDGQDVQNGDDTGTAPENEKGQQDQGGAGEEEVVITIGDEAPPASDEDETQPAPPWVKDLRKADREKAKRIRELEAKLAEKAAPAAPGSVAVGDKPTLEACDFDAERFESELTAWHERKRQADEQAANVRKEQEAAQAAWNSKLTAYNAAKATLKVTDFDDAEATLQETLSPTQLGIILNGADKPEQLVYALGKNPAKAKELASIKDPVKYAFAVAKLETQLKVTPRKVAPAPERVVRGSAAATGMDTTLERLEAEADRTGDRSKVAAYRKQLRAQGKS